MSLSVNTNLGAMAALQSLSKTNSDLSTTQSRINTGLKVNSTKDDSAYYTIAQRLRGDVGGLAAVTSSLNRAKSTTDVAVAGGEQISDLLNQMKAKATEASDAGQDQASIDSLNADFGKLNEQINTIISASSFNGTNLLDSTNGDTVSALTTTTDLTATLNVANLDLNTSIGTIAGFTDAATAQTAVTNVQTAFDDLSDKLSQLGAASRQIDGQLSFTSKLSDTIEGGIGNLVDADLAKESAHLQALQVKQQLGVQALSIANQAPQTIISLFR